MGGGGDRSIRVFLKSWQELLPVPACGLRPLPAGRVLLGGGPLRQETNLGPSTILGPPYFNYTACCLVPSISCFVSHLQPGPLRPCECTSRLPSIGITSSCWTGTARGGYAANRRGCWNFQRGAAGTGGRGNAGASGRESPWLQVGRQPRRKAAGFCV